MKLLSFLSLLFLFIIHQEAFCQFDISNVTIETSGLPSEYSAKLKAKENGDWLMFIGSTSVTLEGWGHDFYVNCYMNIDENRYETYANNNDALNDYNYFIVRSPNLMIMKYGVNRVTFVGM